MRAPNTLRDARVARRAIHEVRGFLKEAQVLEQRICCHLRAVGQHNKDECRHKTENRASNWKQTLESGT
jgi:hypothetical protein